MLQYSTPPSADVKLFKQQETSDKSGKATLYQEARGLLSNLYKKKSPDDKDKEMTTTTTTTTPYVAHDEAEKPGGHRGHRSERRNNNTISEQRSSERSSGGFANALDPMYNTSTSSTIIKPDPGDDTIGIHKPYEAQHHLLGKSDSICFGGCRDVIFAILFYAHVGALIYCAAMYAPVMALDMASNAEASFSNNNGSSSSSSSSGARRRLVSTLFRFLDEQQAQDGEAADYDNDNNQGAYDNSNSNSNNNSNSYMDDDIDIDPQALLLILCFASVIGFVLSSFGLLLMISFAETLIKLALWFNILLLGGLAVLAILSGGVGAFPAALLFLLLASFAACYAYTVWSRIPFAASNLVTAVTAVRDNIGLAFYAYWSVGVLFLWSILWFIATSSTLYVLADCNAADGDCEGSINGLLLFAFILSFYWTAQVISNVVHVTTAGTVGTWWFHPREARGCCSKAVRQSYIRALTTSFGSICLGSLIVAIVQALKEMVQRAQDQDSVLACVVVCLMGCLESLAEYFNKWAFVFVGLYGVSFMEAGSSVMSLFRTRGWTAIIADLMVDTVLCMVSVGVGLLTGVVAVTICMAAMGVVDMATHVASFGIGFGVGYSTCATLFSIVSSAVNTVIVLYAEAPSEFQQNYPELSTRMRDSWRQAWPNEFAY